MGSLVCMSLEEMERSVLTERTVTAVHSHQECVDVIFLTPVETTRASTSTLAIITMMHMVIISKLYYLLYIIDHPFT